METTAESTPFVWQPLTPRGLAAFARASLTRLWLVQLATALLVGGTAAWFLHTAWFPVVNRAIRQLPDSGRILHGRLEWPADSPVVLAQGRFLSLSVDLRHQGTARSAAHVQVEFGHRDLKALSLFGVLERDYPTGWTVAFNRPAVEPWWGAWSPMLLALTVAAVVAALMLAWALLGLLYSLPVWLAGFFANRDLTWAGSWRVAGAALMPGALLLTLSFVVYGLGGLDLIELTIAAAAHLAVGWVYLFLGVWAAPRLPGTGAPKENPFVRATGD